MMNRKKHMIYQIILRYQQERENIYSSNIKTYHGRFSDLRTLKSPFKLKIFNCSHRHSIESIVRQGSFIMLHCELEHCGELFWVI